MLHKRYGKILYGETKSNHWASDIVDAIAVREVWATIIRPDFNPGSPGVPITDLATVKLEYSTEKERYEGIYDQFDRHGIYRVSIYAMDNDEMISLPKSTTVFQKKCKGDFDDDADVDGSDLAGYAYNSVSISVLDFAAGYGQANCLQ